MIRALPDGSVFRQEKNSFSWTAPSQPPGLESHTNIFLVDRPSWITDVVSMDNAVSNIFNAGVRMWKMLVVDIVGERKCPRLTTLQQPGNHVGLVFETVGEVVVGQTMTEFAHLVQVVEQGGLNLGRQVVDVVVKGRAVRHGCLLVVLGFWVTAVMVS